jgi:hypothetical protein
MTSEGAITRDEWFDQFKPILNPLDPTRNSFGPAVKEIELLSQYAPQRVWSQLWDFYGERHALVPGMYPPQGSEEDIYFVTENPWDRANIQVLMPYE